MSDDNQVAEFIYLMAVLVLVISALMVRKIPIGRGLRMFAGWVIFFLAVFVAFSLKDDVIELGRRMLGKTEGEKVAVQSGPDMRVKQSLDGHFWVDAELNGHTFRFLVDSGATTTSIAGSTARRAGIEPARGLPALVQTANGTVAVQRGRAGRLRLGTIERKDLTVHISDGFGEVNVLGMNFLSSLSGWGVENGWLVLKP